MLTDPETGKLSNREIARRLGVSPQSVSNWRRLLAKQPDKGAAASAPQVEDKAADSRPRGPAARLLTIPLLRRRQNG